MPARCRWNEQTFYFQANDDNRAMAHSFFHNSAHSDVYGQSPSVITLICIVMMVLSHRSRALLCGSILGILMPICNSDRQVHERIIRRNGSGLPVGRRWKNNKALVRRGRYVKKMKAARLSSETLRKFPQWFSRELGRKELEGYRKSTI